MSSRRELRSHDCGRHWQLFGRLVVIEHDHVKSVLVAGGLNLAQCSNAAISRDQHSRARARELRHCSVGDAITLTFSVRNERSRVDPDLAQTLGQDRGSRDPVDVVIAVDRDRLAAGRGLHDAFDCLVPVAEWSGIGQSPPLRIQKLHRFSCRVDPTQSQQPADERRRVQSHDRRSVRRLSDPPVAALPSVRAFPHSRYGSQRLNTRQALCPPNPIEFEIATRTSRSRAVFGVQSRSQSGSGVW